jgi:hypothetical protein
MANEATPKARCMKCKADRDVRNPQVTEMPAKGGGKRRTLTGACSVCGGKVFRFLPKAG